MQRFKEASVLYIDDLFKSKDNAPPTPSDVQKTFQMLNFRYNNGLPTIISSELTIDRILQIDEATGGRIKEMCDQCLNIARDSSKNFRLK